MFSRLKLRQKIIVGILVLSLLIGIISPILINMGSRMYDLSRGFAKYTKNTEISQKFEASYSTMKEAFSEGKVNMVRSIAAETLDEFDDMKTELQESNQQVRDVLDDIDSEDLNNKQNDYEEELIEKLSQAEAMLDKIANSSDNIEENLESYSKLFGEGKSELTDEISNDEFNPENVITADYVEIDVNEAESIAEVLTVPVMLGVSATSEDLSLEGDVALSDEIMAKADELKTPYAVYEFVRNNINYEAYYGSRKGAVGTYDSLAGNDADTASLLIGMLRYLGYSARYANGTVRISIEQAMQLTGADDGRNAVQILINMGRSVKLYSENGQLSFVDMNQTWVEAYIPYTDYRGVGNAQGEYMWIPLDASFKSYDFRSLDIETNGEKFTSYNESVSKADELLCQLPEYENVADIMRTDIETKWSVPVIVPFDSGYLPLSLEYDVINEKTSATIINLVPSDTVTISVGYGINYTVRSADVYNKSIALDYSPATESDKNLLEKYGSISEVPAYLIMLVPTLNIDDVAVATGDEFFDAVSPGTEQKMQITIKSCGINQTETDIVTAGSVYSLVLHYGMISANEYETAYENTRENNFHATTANIYSSEILGSFLTFAGRTYYSMTDVPNRYSAYAYNVSETMALGCTVVSYNLNKETLFGYVRALLPGNFKIDVEFNSRSTVDLCAENDNSKLFGMITGFSDSRSEARVWEILLNVDSVSTIDVLSVAAENGMETVYINSNNYTEEIKNVTCDTQTRTDIKNFVNQGFTIIIPENEVNVNDWKGIGYIAANFDTGSVVYRLSGLINGGSTTEDANLASPDPYVEQISDSELEDYICASMYVVSVLYNVYSVIHYTQMISSVASFSADVYTGDIAGFVFGGMSIVNSVCTLNTTISRYYNTLYNFLDYACDNNKDAGREIVKTALEFLADFYKDMDISREMLAGLIKASIDKVIGIESCSERILTIKELVKNMIGVDLLSPIADTEREMYMSFAFGSLSLMAMDAV